MRFDTEWRIPEPRVRIRTWFAWFPAMSERETRWLEWVTAEEYWKCGSEDFRIGNWHISRFIDKPIKA